MKLGSLVKEIRVGYEPRQDEQLPYIGLEHVEKETLQLSGFGWSNEAGSTKRKFIKGDILFGTLRPYFRKVVIAPFDGVCSTDITVLRPQNTSDRHYSFFAISSQPIIDYASAIANGTKMPRAKWKDVAKVDWEMPDKNGRERIGRALFDYQELIDVNNKRITILEQMAEQIYKEWFERMRFPGYENTKFVKGIPQGWEFKKLKDICHFNNASLRKGSAPEIIRYVDIRSVSTHSIDSDQELRFTEAPSRARRIVKHGDIIWSSVRPANRAFARIIRPTSNTIVSTGFIVLTPKESVPTSFIYYFTTSDGFVDYISAVAKGAAYPAASVNDFEETDIVVPPNSLLERYAESAEKIEDTIYTLQQESELLQRAKSLLLPRLIGGKIELKVYEELSV